MVGEQPCMLYRYTYREFPYKDNIGCVLHIIASIVHTLYSSNNTIAIIILYIISARHQNWRFIESCARTPFSLCKVSRVIQLENRKLYFFFFFTTRHVFNIYRRCMLYYINIFLSSFIIINMQAMYIMLYYLYTLYNHYTCLHIIHIHIIWYYPYTATTPRFRHIPQCT